MNKKVLYSRTSVSRKPAFRLSTSIYEANGQRWVEKTAAHQDAQSYLNDLKDKENLLQKNIKGLIIVTSKLENGKIIAPYVNGDLLDKDFRQHLIDGDWGECLNLLLKVLKLIDTQEQSYIDFYNSAEFKEIFGTSWNGKHRALQLGYLDYNLDNLIRTDSGLVLIDYEFTFGFPLPIDMVKCRFLLSYLERYHGIFSLLSNQRKLTSLTDRLLVPSSWLKNSEVSRLLTKHLSATIKSENSFQEYYSFGYSPIGVIPIRVPSTPLEPPEFLLSNLKQTEDLVSKQTDELQKLRNRNQYLENYADRINRLLPIRILRKTKSLVRKLEL